MFDPEQNRRGLMSMDLKIIRMKESIMHYTRQR